MGATCVVVVILAGCSGDAMEWLRERENTIATCMAEQGFEYVPALPDPEDLDMGTGPAAGTPEYVEIEAAVTLIAEFPQSGSPRLGAEVGLTAVRTIPTRGFPYLLAYSDDTDPLRVHRVLHTSRDIPAELGDLIDGS